MTRRNHACATLLIFAGILTGCVDHRDRPQVAKATSPPASQSDANDAFLDDLSRRSFAFFWEQADPTTGLIADRANADGGKRQDAASIASVGFGLTAICIADQRGWISHVDAYARTLLTLRFLRDTAPTEHGYYFHFLDMTTGKRIWNCELSSIDTALLMTGVMTAKQHFAGTEIQHIAQEIFDRVDWPWMLNGGKTLSMGWTPETGFFSVRWDGYSEHMVLELMGLGSTTHPLPPRVWDDWQRRPIMTYAGKTYLQCPPLFTHQYSHAYFNFRNQRDAHADYWTNSIYATLAHRQFCLDLRPRFPTYGANLWGISASDSETGYQAWGGPPPSGRIDGSIVPCAAGGSIPFAPEICIATLRNMRDTYGDRVWKRYGFVDAFNPSSQWTNKEVIGSDIGVTLLMAENSRSGFVWKHFMASPEIQRASRLAGFANTDPTLPPDDKNYLHALARDTWNCIATMVEPSTGLPYDNHRGEFTSVSNIGLYLTDIAAAREMGLIDSVDAERGVTQTLASVERLKTWHGFQQCWNSVKTLAPATHDTWVSVLDSGNFAAGLITVGQAFPNLHDRTQKLVSAMDWSFFYDRQRDALIGGYDTSKDKLNVNWQLKSLGSDAQLALFLAGAKWDSLDRSLEHRYGTSYLKPGWQGGGLFMQYISGLWLDIGNTRMARSAQNFAYAQIRHAREKNYPVWGWSACASPDGKYLGMGALKDEIVTPHASVLAIGDFPQEVVRNLRALESMGARGPNLGFVDSIDLTSSKTSDDFLMLDQSMLFISLANYLRSDVVRRWFQADPIVQRGRQWIADYQQPQFAECSVFDLSALLAQPAPSTARKSFVANRFDGWRSPAWVVLNGAQNLESGTETDANRVEAKFALAWDEQTLHVRIDVRDASVISDVSADHLYEQDCVELFIDPRDDGLHWGDAADFQFGFAPTDKCFEFFGKNRSISASVLRSATGYTVDAAIPWKLLGIEPRAGETIGVSPAVKSIGAGDEAAVKLNWNWRPGVDAIELGRAELK